MSEGAPSTPFALSEVEVRVIMRSACGMSFDFAQDERWWVHG